MMKILKYFVLVILILVVVAGGGAVWLYQAGQDKSAPPSTKIPTAADRTDAASSDVDLSPANWDPELLASLIERNASFGGADTLATGENGVIAGTTGAPAVHAGLTVLEEGGNAIDALLTTSLAQIALATGSWVSYAGIFQLVYYDAASGEVYNLNAGYNSFLGEDDPASIPTEMNKDGEPTPSGRTALVPGYFAGVEAAHEKFGTMPFEELFEPAIYFAEDGFPLPDFLEKAVERRKDVLTRLPETKAVFTKDDGSFYSAGETMKQPALAKTLRAVAAEGADYIYHGPWAEKFVDAVKAEGGKVSIEDMNRYEVIWQAPLEHQYGDYTLFLHGRPGQGGTHLAEALNLVEVSGLAEIGDYRENPEAFFWFSQLTHTAFYSFIPEAFRGALMFGLDLSMENRSSKKHAEQLWAKMSEGKAFGIVSPKDSKHSDAIVVIDQRGNMAAATHTINTASWGGTGIFVDGISIPDSAAFQQAQLAELKPGSRLPDPTEPLILFKDGKPYGAFSSIGAGLHQKTFTVLYNLMQNAEPLAGAMAAPSTHLPLFNTENFREPPAVQVAEGEFSEDVLSSAREMGLQISEFPNTLEGRAPRGYVVGAIITDTGDYEAVAPKLFNAPAEGF